MRDKVVRLVQRIVERPEECIAEISQYIARNYPADVSYSHIWTSYVANKAGLDENQAPLTASCDRGANWFRRRKRYKLSQAYGGDYSPYRGDFIYFSSTCEQADATDVGIVLDSNGMFVKFVHWNGYCLEVEEWYINNYFIIGYGIPVYSGMCEVLPCSVVEGNNVAIMNHTTHVYEKPNNSTKQLGTLKEGHSVVVLETTPTGWLKVVWGLSETGYAYIDNHNFFHKVLKDELPYQKSKGFKVGDYVRFNGGRLFKQATTNSKSKIVISFIGKITGENNGMFHLETRGIKGWVNKTDVDFISQAGYNKRKGEIAVVRACLRVGPGREFTKVQKWPQLVKDNIVDVLGIETDNDKNEWLLVAICGVKGYVEDYCVNYIEV